MSTALQILYNDKKVIPYRRELRPLLGSVNAAILFQEAVYLHGLKNKDDGEMRPFYMFKQPPAKHPLYSPGQSWVELLGFSPREFDGAIKKIGTKISIRKDDLREVLERSILNADPRGLLIYWTTADRITYYLLNVPLAELVIEFSYNVFQPESDWTWVDARRQFKEFVQAELEKAKQQMRVYVNALFDDPKQQMRVYVNDKFAFTYPRNARLVIIKEEQKDLQKDLQKDYDQQQQPIQDKSELNAETGDDNTDAAVVEELSSGEISSCAENPSEEDGFTVQDALRVAGIKGRTAKRIPAVWKSVTGEDLTPEDILAWHFYREEENRNLPAGRRLRPAYIIANLELGERVDEEFYERAREYLAELVASEEESEPPEPPPPRLIDLHRALEAYLPPLDEIDIEALDALRGQLHKIAYDLLDRSITAEDLTDLRLYLTYTGQPIPRPDEVANVLVQAGTEFQAWRERKAEAENLWEHIVRQGEFAAPGSAIDQAMRRATAVDLNGALVILADAGLEPYFTRLWPRKAATVLSGTEFPKDLSIQFITPPTQ